MARDTRFGVWVVTRLEGKISKIGEIRKLFVCNTFFGHFSRNMLVFIHIRNKPENGLFLGSRPYANLTRGTRDLWCFEGALSSLCASEVN